VIDIGRDMPSSTSIAANAHALARYAAICQEAGLVPIVEPEVLMDGDHTIDRCEEVTEWTLNAVYEALYLNRVVLEHTVLKPSMVISGKKCSKQASVDEVAARTVRTLKRTVPGAVAGIVFLSGGQSDELATAHLNSMNQQFKGNLPWPLSFSYGRALQQPSLKAWKGQATNVPAAQAALAHRSRMNGLASLGRYSADLERKG
jgi:fructose-bisphosphate aldolase class I